MKYIFMLAMLSAMTIQAQESDLNVMIIATKFDGGPMSELGEYLLDMDMDLSVGNACGEGFTLVTTVPGDLNMNGNNLQLLETHIIVQGEILNEGTIAFHCDSAVLEFEDTLSTPTPVTLKVNKIYPNPANDFINVNGENIRYIQFVNSLGQTVKYYETIAQRNKIMVDNLPSGTYYIKVYDNSNNVHTTKLIIK